MLKVKQLVKFRSFNQQRTGIFRPIEFAWGTVHKAYVKFPNYQSNLKAMRSLL